MTGNTFVPDAVARAAKLMCAGTDPRAIRRQVHSDHPELTRYGIERMLGIAREEIAEQDSSTGRTASR